MDSSVNILNWFEIPVNDINRAKNFYETIFSIQMSTAEMMDTQMAFFPAEDMNGKVSGALAKGNMYKPSVDGAKIYLNANPDLGVVLDKVNAAGGQITMPKTLIAEHIGYMAFFIDTEGNGMALHSSK